VFYLAKNNYYKATATVVISSCGFFLSYPFHGFWGGLISSSCSAAMIGGLADWFAVTALFRRPLGIKPGRIIRTEIIPRNRKRIFIALSGMVQNELLAPEILKQRVTSYNISHMFLRYLEEHGGSEDINSILDYLLEDALDKLDPKTLGQLVEQVVEQGVAGFKTSPLLLKVLNYSLAKGYDEKLVNFVVEQLLALTKHPQTGIVIYQLIKEALEAYEKGMDRRKFVDGLLLQLSPVSLAELVQKKLAETLEAIKDNSEHPLRLKLKLELVRVLDTLEHQPEVQYKIEAWKNTYLSKLNLGDWISKGLTDRTNLPIGKLFDFLHSELEQLLQSFKTDHTQQKRVDQFLKQALTNWIDREHGQIGALVRDNLNKFSNQSLVELIEDKAGNDLQMIRINGTVVGGLVGLLIYLLSYWLG
jgi:uncharacterized membrane-anchored protein YjiN (DUF445 family)